MRKAPSETYIVTTSCHNPTGIFTVSPLHPHAPLRNTFSSDVRYPELVLVSFLAFRAHLPQLGNNHREYIHEPIFTIKEVTIRRLISLLLSINICWRSNTQISYYL